MSAERKRASKSETLTIRLDQKARFAIEFIARLRGQNITTVIERAIRNEANKERLGPQGERGWLDYWHVSEGIRFLQVAMDEDLHPTFEEDEIVDFVRTHWQFFALNSHFSAFNQSYIDILWPRIHEFVQHWRDNKAVDRWATGKLMQDALRAAKERPPEWPPQPPQPSSRKLQLDDDIPF